MSNSKHGFASTLCRCGRTTSLDNSVVRRGLECGHYICADCWHYTEPMPTPICVTCVVALQSQEIPRLSFYVTAYQDLLGRYKELEQIHVQRMAEYKTASDSIAMLKSKLAALHKGQSHGAASSSSPHAPPQHLPNIHNISSSSAGTVGTNKSAAVIDWGSESGKLVSSYIMKQREALTACQKECESLKTRVTELTTQLDAKNQPDPETVTAVEKAELMEAELEGLTERLGKCEEDLQNAQSELATAKTQNEELTKEITGLKERTAQYRSTLTKAQVHITTLQNRCNTAERDLASARESLKAKDEAIRANARAHSRGPSVDLSFSSASTDRTAVYVPTAAELEQTASKLTSLQEEVAKLNREKTALEREISRLKEELKDREQENQVLGGKLLTSAELASELGRLHLAASSRAEAAENKLQAAEKEVQNLKELMAVQEREHKAMKDTVNIVSGLSKQAEYQSRVAQLEAGLAETTRLRDEALAQLESWEQNRHAWKRWGEVMALRAKQWEDEAIRAKIPRAKSGPSPIRLDEPPPLPPVDIVPGGSPPGPGKTRKRPLDMPDTDVDGLDATAQPGDTAMSDLDGEGSERKKARFVQTS